MISRRINLLLTRRSVYGFLAAVTVFVTTPTHTAFGELKITRVHPLACKAFDVRSETDPNFFRRKNRKVILIDRPETSLRKECFGACVPIATLTYLELEMKEKLGKHVRFSVDYLLSEILIARAIKARTSDYDFETDFASDEQEVYETVNATGLLPEANWLKNHSIGDSSKHFQFALTSVKNIIDDDIRTFGLKIGNVSLQRFTNRIRIAMANLAGKAPQRFTWNGQRLNPQEFAKTCLPYDLNRMETYYLSHYFNIGETNEKKADFKLKYLDPIRARIDAGHPVLGGLRIQSQYTDKRTGLISTKWVNRDITVSDEDHQVVFVGYELDAKDQLAGLFFQNNWAPLGGPVGLFEITIDAIEHFDDDIDFQMLPEWLARFQSSQLKDSP